MTAGISASFHLEYLHPADTRSKRKDPCTRDQANPLALKSLTRIVGFVDVILCVLELVVLFLFVVISVVLSPQLDLKLEGVPVNNVLFLVLCYTAFIMVFTLLKCWSACLLLSATDRRTSVEVGLPKAVVWRTFKIFLMCVDVVLTWSDDGSTLLGVTGALASAMFVINLVSIVVVQQFILSLEATSPSSGQQEDYGQDADSNDSFGQWE